ncbi:MAG: cytochrome c oxidase cbb3-type subunit 3/ubiquinol-cytochrome c reductase cytochrome c subunit [Bradymonadia bacterium]|jgi:cytochrome c oxidase cbb3-type subunit 3/ubiquinol-cytochrome c reductase cytochrome c subunit
MRGFQLAIVCVVLALSGCTNRGDDGDQLAESGESAASAAELSPEVAEFVSAGAADYEQYCAFCHGDEGQGYLADDANALNNPTFLATATDDFLRAAIVHGRPGTPMSGWGVEKGGPLTEDQVSDLVAFIREWQTVPSVELSDEPLTGTAGRGRGPYNVYCASCHALDGLGGSGPALANPWLLHTASDEYLRYAIVHGRPSTPMAAYGDSLSDTNILNIVALIRSWQLPVDEDPPPPYEPDFENALINPDGGVPEFELREDRFVSIHAVAEAIAAGQSVVIVDARPNSDYALSRIEGAINVPFYDVSKFADRFPDDQWLITYCGCPHAVSGQAADLLRQAGFSRVAVLDEGFYEWEDAGYSVATSSR